MISKRKRKRKYIDREGKEYIFEDSIEVNLKSGSLEDVLEVALKADEDDKIIQRKAIEIKNFIRKTSENKNTLKKWYELGKILRFVDRLNLKDEISKREAFQRLFQDLKVDTERNPSMEKIIRYPQHMYALSRVPRELVFYRGMNWSRWFDILEYKFILNNRKLLGEIVRECCENNWSTKKLRKELQIINRKLKSGNE